MIRFESQFHLAKSQSGLDAGDIHTQLMWIGWVLFSNLGLWCHFFKYSPLAIYLHFLFMCITVLLAWGSGILAIVVFGLSSMAKLQTLLGLVILVLMLGVAGGGAICYILRTVPKLKPELVVVSNKIHRIGGWIILLIVWLLFLTSVKKGQFIFVLLVNLFSYGLFLLCKFKIKNKIQYNPLGMAQNKAENEVQKLKQIQTTNQLNQFQNNYFIFEDKIYGTDHVQANHPGGWQIVKSIKGRQVDRYLYGTQPLENATVVNSHFSESIKLAQKPLAVLYNLAPYLNLNSTNEVSIQELKKPCKSNKIYVVHLSSKQTPPFYYTGYSKLNQFGKYWALQDKSRKMTRLFSVVNFLHSSNVQLIQKINNGVAFWQKEKVIKYNNQVHEVANQQDNSQLGQTIPLFIKRYEKGAFTNQFLSGDFSKELILSKPRGRGLLLHQHSPGIILIMAAGTGFNPFCDLVDVLFKQSLVKQSHPLAGQILKANPILKQTQLSIFRLVIVISVDQVVELHPITLFQLNYLAGLGLIQINIVSKDSSTLSAYPNINRLAKQNIQGYVSKLIHNKNQDIRHIYVCGPPRYNGFIVDMLNQQNVKPYMYKIL